MGSRPSLVIATTLLISAAAHADTPVGDQGGGGMAPVPTAPAPADPAPVKSEDVPTAVRLRSLEQKTQALKERAWQLKARVQLLKEQMIGGGVGAQATITHASDMGSSFRITKLLYTLDGTQVFVRTDDEGETLYKTSAFDVFTGPIAPGNHTLLATAVYRGHGFGLFSYLSDYTFTVTAPTAFVVGEGKNTKVACRGYEKGGATVAIEKRAAIECKVTESAPDKVSEPVQTTPGTTPLPESGK
jgi:hypothetical protein